jgi:hypothetical protein
MKKEEQIFELLKICELTLKNIEKSFDQSLEEIGGEYSYMKKKDPIQYEVGLSEYERENKFEIIEKLKKINYNGNNKEVLSAIEEIEIYLN